MSQAQDLKPGRHASPPDPAGPAEPLDPSLVNRFRSCVRYLQAPSWQKPFLAPGRFLRNQLAKYGLLHGVPGSIRNVAAFHFDPFAIVEGELVSQQIASYGVYEPELTEAFLHLVRPGQVVLDIGMHLGYYATLFAVLVGSAGQVHAFEPTPSTRDLARRNNDRFPQIRVHPLAVWSSARSITLRDYGLRWMGFNSLVHAKLKEEPTPPREINAQTVTLDEFRASLDRPVGVIKIDAESAERDIIRGAHHLLHTDRPLVSVEVGDAPGSTASRDLVADLEALGFVPWEFIAGSFAHHRKREQYTYSNLVFAPPGLDLSANRRFPAA